MLHVTTHLNFLFTFNGENIFASPLKIKLLVEPLFEYFENDFPLSKNHYCEFIIIIYIQDT